MKASSLEARGVAARRDLQGGFLGHRPLPPGLGKAEAVGIWLLQPLAEQAPFDFMIFRNDHNPSYFNVLSSAISAKFAIVDCALFSSKERIRRYDIRPTEKWEQKHRAALYLNWDLCAQASRPSARVSIMPFLANGGVFEALNDPDYFVWEMQVLRGSIGLTWPDEVDFSADGLRQDAFPAEPSGGDEPVTAARTGYRGPTIWRLYSNATLTFGP